MRLSLAAQAVLIACCLLLVDARPAASTKKPPPPSRPSPSPPPPSPPPPIPPPPSPSPPPPPPPPPAPPSTFTTPDPRISSMCKEFEYTNYYYVTTTSQLLNRLANAVKGDMIELKADTAFYLSSSPNLDPTNDPARGRTCTCGDTTAFAAATTTSTYNGVASSGMLYKRHGTATQYITLCGPTSAVIDGSDTTKYKSAALSIISSSYIRVAGISFQWALKTIDVQNSTYVDIYKVNTRYSLQENIRLRYNTMYSQIRNSTIQQTGWMWQGTGEGIYIGTGIGNSVDIGGPEDHTNNNTIHSNTFAANVTAECIDVKEYSSFGEIHSNTFNGSALTGVHGAVGWVAAKGNNWIIHHNKGSNTIANGNGFKTAIQAPGWGQQNRFTYNECHDLPNSAYCVELEATTETTSYVGCNTLTNSPGAQQCNYNIVQPCGSTTVTAQTANTMLAGTTTTTTTTDTGRVSHNPDNPNQGGNDNGKPEAVTSEEPSYRYDETY